MKNVSKKSKKIKVAMVGSVPISLHAFKHYFMLLENHGCEITLITSPNEQFSLLDHIPVHAKIGVTIHRDISLFNDFIAIVKLFFLFRRENFDIVHSKTPKGGLICAIAGFFARVPVRIHTYTGQRWDTLSGLKRRLLQLCDQIIGTLNTFCYADSHSQAQYLVDLKIIRADKISCLAQGSFAGIDLEQIPYPSVSVKNKILSQIAFNNDYPIISFLGRVTKDKGVDDLINAFLQVREEIKVNLLLIGPYEEADPISAKSKDVISHHPNIRCTGFVSNIYDYLSVSCVHCLPSYREGFSTSILEAAALGIPTVGSNIVGVKDAIINGENGLLFPLGNIEQFVHHLKTLLQDETKLKMMGEKAKERVGKEFTAEKITEELYAEYQRLLKESGVSY